MTDVYDAHDVYLEAYAEVEQALLAQFNALHDEEINGKAIELIGNIADQAATNRVINYFESLEFLDTHNEAILESDDDHDPVETPADEIESDVTPVETDECAEIEVPEEWNEVFEKLVSAFRQIARGKKTDG